MGAIDRQQLTGNCPHCEYGTWSWVIEVACCGLQGGPHATKRLSIRVSPPSRSSRRDWSPGRRRRQIHTASRGTYGAHRVHAELTLGRGIRVGHNAVAMLMRRAGLAGLSGRRGWRRIPNMATAADLVDRRFTRDRPDQLWVTDVTEHPTREGKVYCAVVLDVFSRRVVGWSIDASPTAALVINALSMAIDERQPSTGTLPPRSMRIQQLDSTKHGQLQGVHRTGSRSSRPAARTSHPRSFGSTHPVRAHACPHPLCTSHEY